VDGKERELRTRSSAQAHSVPDHAALVFQCLVSIEVLHVQTAATSLARFPALLNDFSGVRASQKNPEVVHGKKLE
jgi:hypothetical protein